MRITVLFGVLLILIGSSLYFFNYERQTIDVGDKTDRRAIIEYHAPEWDPFPHYVRIIVDTDVQVEIQVTIEASSAIEAGMSNEVFHFQSGEERRTIYPGETVRIAIDNHMSATGSIQTVLWCDSWNYAAAIFLVGGALLVVISKISLSD